VLNSVSGDVAGNGFSNGDVVPHDSASSVVAVCPYSYEGLSDLSPLVETITYLASFVEAPSIGDKANVLSLQHLEADIVFNHAMALRAQATAPTFSFKTQSYDLVKAPFSYSEAVARPDAQV